ncbi:MAG: PAS domain S-box protein, partial [Bacteroidota bacterium]
MRNRKADALFRAMVEKSSDGITLLSRQGTVLYHSPAVERILGWSPEEREGKQMMDLVHPNDQGFVRHQLSRILEQPGSVTTVEVRVRHKDGSWRWVEGLTTNLLEEPAVGAMVVNYRDITSRKQAEEYTQKITAAIEQAEDLVFITDVDGTIRYVNAAFERVTGYQREEVIGKNPRILKSGEHSRSFYESLWKTLLAGGTFRGRFLNRKKTGEIYVDDRTIAPVKNASGQIVAFVSTGRDVTEQLELERKLEQKSKIIQAFFDFSVSPMVLLDSQFNFIDVNEAYAKACGKERKDFLGRNHFDLYPSDAKADFEKVVKTKQPVRFIRRPFVFPDHPEWGVTYWDWTLTPVLDDRRNVDVLVFFLNDVTQQVQAEQKLREREEFLRKLTDAVGVAIFSISFPDRTIMYVNRGTAECFGCSAEEMIGRTTRILYPDDSHYEAYGLKLRQALEQGKQGVHAELRLVRKNGEHFWADVHTTFLSTGGEPRHVISVVRDITGQKKMNEELHRSREQLRLLYANLQRRREEERARIAREIHDSIGQSLTVLKMDMALLTDDLHYAKDTRQFGSLVKRIESINSVIDSATKVVREISSEMRPVI